VLQLSGPPVAAYYLAPEQVRGEAPSAASDIYSLGLILYQCATGSLPFEADTAGGVAALQAESEPEPARRINPNVPASLEVVIMHALRKDPKERYRTVDEMRQDLDRVADQIQGGITSEAGTERKKRPWWVWAIVAAVLFTLIAGAAVGGFVWWRRNMTQVPSLVGLTPNAAQTKISASGLAPGTISFTSTPVVGLPEGVIATQSPLPGGWVRVGTRVGVVVSGPERVLVPNVVGSSEASALAAIQNAGFTIAAINSVFDKAVAAGNVVTQTPSAGLGAPKGSGVAMTVSKGQQVSTVPGVVGETQSIASSVLSQAGFKTTVSQQYSDAIVAGTVMAQSPTGGSPSSVGVTVALVVSQGPKPVTVPYVVGQTLANAVSNVQSAGLKVSLSTRSVDATVGPPVKRNPAIGLVYSQSPSSGSSARVGDTVNLTYNQP
jgi:eukaryotic-like serine/threonine-protein kinase